MKRLVTSIILILLMLSLFADDQIQFSGGYSKVSLKEGREELILSGGANVIVGSMAIKADTITLSGSGYSTVSCSGKIVIEDKEKGLTIKTSTLLYDRSRETLLISAWSEISDTVNEMEASSAALYYDMNSEILQMQMQVRLLKNTDSGVLSAKAENVTYNRNASTLTLSGAATVTWRGDNYTAEVITIDTENETISLDGRIEGTVRD